MFLKYINENTNGQEEYGYACGRIRELEKTLLTSEILNKLIESTDYESCLRMLTEIPLDEYLFEENQDIPIHYYLDNIMKKNLRVIEEISPYPFLPKLLKNKYDFYNLKVLLKAKLTFSKDEIPAFDIGNIPLERIKEAVFENKLQSVPMLVERLIKEAEEEYMKTDSLFILETMLSNGYFEMIFNELNNINNDFLTSYYKTEVDLLNIIIACRSKIRHIKKTNLLEYLIKNGRMHINKLSQIYENSIQSWPNYFQKTDYEALVSEGIKYWQDNKSLTRIEILKDNYLLDLLKIGKYTSFGLESIIGYIYAKENDIKNIRIILNAKKYLLSKNIIKNNVRDTYV